MDGRIVFPLRRADPAYLHMLEMRIEDVERRAIRALEALGNAMVVTRGRMTTVSSCTIMSNAVLEAYDELDEAMADDNGDSHTTSLEPQLETVA